MDVLVCNSGAWLADSSPHFLMYLFKLVAQCLDFLAFFPALLITARLASVIAVFSTRWAMNG
jgi:hypothetical protein